MSLNDWLTNSYKVLTAVRITIIPPWKIQDVDGHPAINLGAIATAIALVLAARLFTAEGDGGLTTTALTAIFSVLFLFFCGLVVNFTHPDSDNTKLANRWSTFFIVAFGYALVFFILLCLAVPTLTAHNFLDTLSSFANSDLLGELYACLIVTLLSIFIIYARTKWWFAPMLETNPMALITTMIIAAIILTSLLLCVLFLLQL